MRKQSVFVDDVRCKHENRKEQRVEENSETDHNDFLVVLPRFVVEHDGVPLRFEHGDRNSAHQERQVLSEVVHVESRPKGQNDHEQRNLEGNRVHVLQSHVCKRLRENVNEFLFGDVPRFVVELVRDGERVRFEHQSVVVESVPDVDLHLFI